uniref:Transmembrane protein 238 like n=1 Tax=Gasterosteus aculeatus aculeatus TaxID=481459 RepID=A0AAQ4Q9T9_GASAC
CLRLTVGSPSSRYTARCAGDVRAMLPVTRFGGCLPALLAAALFDVLGVVLLFVGIFAPLSFWDFFVLSGPLLIFLSLVFWIFWYMGNLTVTEEELNLTKSDIL